MKNKTNKKNHAVHDVHEEFAKINVLGGVGNLTHIHKGKDWMLPIRYSILVPTNKRRGVHMSRLVAAAQKNRVGERIEFSMRQIRDEIDRTQPGCMIICDLQYPYEDQFMPIRIMVKGNRNIYYAFQRIGITACPCSKQLVGVGHMQRSILKMKIKSREIIDFNEVAEKMGNCFSTVPEEHLKRKDEGEKILEAQNNPKFTEDVARECLKRFPQAISIKVKSLESIHLHDAISYWNNKIIQ